MGPYETNGDLSIPLVTIHTTADDVAPFAHELLYLPKVDTSARGLFLPVPIQRYGHCNFTATEIAPGVPVHGESSYLTPDQRLAASG